MQTPESRAGQLYGLAEKIGRTGGDVLPGSDVLMAAMGQTVDGVNKLMTRMREAQMTAEGDRPKYLPSMGWHPVEFRPIDGVPVAVKRVQSLTVADTKGGRMFVVNTRDPEMWEQFRPGRVGGFTASELRSGKRDSIAATYESDRVVVASRARHGEAREFVAGTIVFVEF